MSSTPFPATITAADLHAGDIVRSPFGTALEVTSVRHVNGAPYGFRCDDGSGRHVVIVKAKSCGPRPYPLDTKFRVLQLADRVPPPPFS